MLGVLLNMLASQEEVARRLGKHPSWVSKRVRLLASAPAAKAVRDREVSVEQAYTVLSRAADDAEAAREIARLTAYGEPLRATLSRLPGKGRAGAPPPSTAAPREAASPGKRAGAERPLPGSLSFDELPHLRAVLATLTPPLTDDQREGILKAVETDLTGLLRSF